MSVLIRITGQELTTTRERARGMVAGLVAHR